MIKVEVKNGDLDKAFRNFKRKLALDGTPSEYKKREHYSKPGVVRREARKAGIKNSRKRQNKNRDRD